MKRVFKPIVGLMVLLCPWACADESIVETSSGESSLDGHAVIELEIPNENKSRLAYEGTATTFATGDQIGVIGDAYNNLSFTISETVSRAYSDDPLTMETNSKFYSYYPYSATVDDFTKYPIAIAEEQKQPDAQYSHVSEYDIMVTGECTVKKSTVASFKHIGAWIDMAIYNRDDQPLTVNSMEIKSSSKSFVKNGTINVLAKSSDESYLKVVPNEYTDVVKVVATGSEWNTVEKNKKVTLRAAVLPSDLSGDTITVTLNLSTGVVVKKFAGRNLESGCIYQLSYNDKQVYIPSGTTWVPSGEERFNWGTADLYNDDSYFCWRRSKQTENLVIFWEPEFGDDPSKAKGSYRVDVDRVLEQLEECFRVYRDELKMVIPGYSNTDKYKVPIYLYYTDGWYAWGGDIGQVGACWVSPSVAKAGADLRAIAHEVGHCLQGFVRIDGQYADPELLYHGQKSSGFSNDNNAGTAFLECSANFMAWQNCHYFPNWTYEIPVHQAQSHKGFLHPWVMYQYYFICGYWQELHGTDFHGRLWRYAKQRSEDPVQAYQRITETSQEQFNDELWMSAAKELTWSFINDEISGYMRGMVDKLKEADRKQYYTNKAHLIKNDVDGYYRIYPDTYTSDQGTSVNYGMAPQSYGHNSIYLKVPEAGTEITIDFEGLKSYPESEQPGYRYDPNRNDQLGWRWGIVACTGEGGWTPVYSDMKRDSKGTLTFTVPEGTKRMFLVVSGAPTEHVRKAYNQRVDDDYEFPYRFKVTGTDVNTNYVKVVEESVVL